MNACDISQGRLVYHNNRKKLLADQRKRYHTNKNVRLHKSEYGKQYRKTHMKRILAYQKVWKARKRAAKLTSSAASGKPKSKGKRPL
ncbi:MAG TPA: hypothetical protein VFS97_04145 [Nitrososphaeraceae archaeon]|nr:hypothetical protein [Nitrososphaeraceae archaeon]